MIRSANEISGMVAKAARGAGLPLGIAEDLAAAIPRHALAGPRAALAALLPHLADPAPLMAHVGALDAGTVPKAQRDAEPDACLHSLGALSDGQVGGAGPFEIDGALWRSLEAWAARTHVPATDASRIAGAGAGLTDND